VKYDIIFFVKVSSEWLFSYMKVISCVLSVLAIPTSYFIVKILFEKSTKLQSLSKCVGRYSKEHVLTLVVN